MDNFSTLGLQDATHNVDGCVMPVKQAGCGDKPDRMGRHVQARLVVVAWL
jgi:hypothetical protein